VIYDEVNSERGFIEQMGKKRIDLPYLLIAQPRE
jgi:hypothetical protein